MSQPITYVGIDAHKVELHVALLAPDASAPVTWKVQNETRAVERLRRKAGEGRTGSGRTGSGRLLLRSRGRAAMHCSGSSTRIGSRWAGCAVSGASTR